MATHALKGEGPPTEAPPFEHAHYTDTLNKQQYLAVGTTDANDWKRVTDQDTGGGSLPVGGDTEDLLTKLSGTDGDADWRPLSDQTDFQNLDTRVTDNEAAIDDKVDEPSTISDRQSVVWEATPGEYQGDHRVKWRGEWTASNNPHRESEMVRDNEWTMIANKETNDRAGITEEGEHNYINEDNPAWNNETDSPLSSSGLVLDIKDNCRISEIRMFRPSDDDTLEYFFTVKDVSDLSDVNVLFSEKVDPGPVGWVPFDVDDTIFLPNTLLEVELVTVATGDDIEWDRQWLYVTATSGDPGPRNWRQDADKGQTQNIAINKQDWALTDATTDLLAMKPGSEFQIAEAASATHFIDYQVQDLIDQGAYIEYTVEVIQQGQSIRTNQLCNIKGISRGAGTSPLVELPNYFTGNDSFWNSAVEVQGFRRSDLTEAIVLTDNSYGVDVKGVKLIKSPDWDIVAASFTSVGGGGTGVDTFLKLKDTPSDYASQGKKTLQVSDDETSVVFNDASTLQNNSVWVDVNYGDDTLDENRGSIDKPFLTLKAALDYVASQNPTDGNDWAVFINPGVYIEEPMSVPRNTSVTGQGEFKANIFPANDSAPLFTLDIFANLTNMNIDGRIGVVGSNSTEPAITCPFAAGNSGGSLLINNFTTGVTLFAGAGSESDFTFFSLSVGQLGPVDNPIIADGNVTCKITSAFLVGVAQIGIDIKNGAAIGISNGILQNSITGVKCDGGSFNANDLLITDVNTVGETSGASVTCILSDSQVFGTGLDDGFKINNTGGNIQINNCSMTGFVNIVNITTSPNVYLSDSLFITSGDGSKAIQVRGTPNFFVRGCTFDSNSLTNTIAIDSGEIGVDFPFVEISDTFFFNYATSILVHEGQSTIRHSTFEVFIGPLAGTVGIFSEGGSNNFIEQCNFSVGFGCRAQDDSQVALAGVRFLNTETDFEQADQALISSTQSNFDEDKVSAENWGIGITGNYNSTKPGDRGLIVTDKLKVGVPELGRISSFGQGASFTRGLLCYTFDSDTDQFQDRTADAQGEGGAPITFPSNSPNSALYISHTLTDENGDSFPFSGLWMNFTSFGDVGQGEIVSEIWNGTSWQEIQDMLSQAEAPYNQIPRGDSVNIPEGKYNFRFDDRIENIWEESDPIGLGDDSYWYRFRIKGNWFNLGWSHRTSFEAQAIAISGNHINIPLMLDLSTLDQTFWDNVQATGDDIRVTDDTGTNQLPVEVSKFDKVAQQGKIWFSSGALSAAENTLYYIYYGNAVATKSLPNAEFGASNVWSEYIAVYHFNETAGDGTTVIDSAKNVKIINGTQEGASITFQTDGILDNYYDYNNVDTDSVNLGTEPELISPTVPLSVQCIFRDPGGNDKRRLISIASANTGANDEDNLGLYIQANTVRASFTSSNVINSGVTVNNDQWRSCHLTTDGNIGGLYVDGGLTGTTTGIGGLTPSPFPARIGNRGSLAGSFSFGGGIDEARFLRNLLLPDRVTTETTNLFFQNLFFVIGASETREEAGQGGGGDPIVSSPSIDQIKIHPMGFQEIGEDGYTQWFGAARPIMPLQLSLNSFSSTPLTGSPPQTGTELWITATSGTLGNYYFGQGIRTTMTAIKGIRTEIDTSSPIRVSVYFAGLSANAGDILWRAVISFSDANTTLFPTSGDAPPSVPKQTEALVLSEIEAGRLGKEEFAVLELALPDIDTSQTYDERSDLAWISIERAGDSELDTYDNTVKILSVSVVGTIWRNGAHTGILGDGPPVGLPGTETVSTMMGRKSAQKPSLNRLMRYHKRKSRVSELRKPNEVSGKVN